jgi:hypothetical protein
VRQVLEAIDAELRGRPLRTTEQQEAISQAQEERGRVTEAMEAAGLTLESTDEEIVAALTRTFQQPSLASRPEVSGKLAAEYEVAPAEGLDQAGIADNNAAVEVSEILWEAGALRNDYAYAIRDRDAVLIEEALEGVGDRRTWEEIVEEHKDDTEADEFVLSEADNFFDLAIQDKGLTDDINEAGYVLPDGRMLDFSGKREGGPSGSRAEDHRQILSEAGVEGTDAMIAFQRMGAVRLDAAAHSVDFEVPPTTAALRALETMFDDGEPVFVDVAEGNRRTSFSVESFDALRKHVGRFYRGAEIEAGQELFQPGKRGSITLTPGLRDTVIRFTQASDMSTLLHEGGHLWLAELQADAAEEGAPELLRKDWDTVSQWLGVAEGQGELTTEQHERFAAGVEQWAMEGRAPSIELEGVFARFSRWLIGVYKSLRHKHFQDVQLNDEMREVMDRLVATEAEIAESRFARGLDPLFTAAEMEAWKPDERERYNAAIERGRIEQHTKLTRRRQAQVRREASEEWANLEAGVREEMEAEVSGERMWQAKHWLQRGEHLGDPPDGMEDLEHMKLDRDALVAIYGKEVLRELGGGRWSLWQKEDGLHPDQAAELFGFESGDQLVRALAASGNMKDEIKARTEATMRDRHGEPENSEALERATVEALANEATVDALLIEERALAQKTGGRVAPQAVLRRIAESVVDRTRVMDLRPDRYRRAALREGRATMEAMADGRAEEAKGHKQRQVFALLMESAARRRKEEIGKGREKLDALGNVNNTLRQKIIKAGDIVVKGEVVSTYWTEVALLLEQFDFRKGISGKEAGRRTSRRAWLEHEESQGNSVAISDKLRDETYRKPWKEMTAAEFSDVLDAVNNIAHLARRKVEFIVGSEHRSMQIAQHELAQSALDNVKQKDTTLKLVKARWDGIRKGLVSAESALIKPEFLIARLDGERPDGFWRRHVWQPLKDAEAKRNEMNERYTMRFLELMGELTAGRSAEFKAQPKFFPSLAKGGFDGRVDRHALISIALNWGNASNRKKLLDGYGWNEAEAKAILDAELTAQDWAFVGEVWKLIGSLWPEIVEQEKKLSGVIPKAVDPVEVVTPYGVLPGGYYPIAYDRDASDIIARHQEKDSLYDRESNAYRPVTGHGHTKERSERFASPILLDLNLIPSHLSMAIHDLTHRETLLRVDALTQGKEVREALKATVGAEQADLFRPWLQSIARDRMDDQKALQSWERGLRYLRHSTTTYTLGLRATTLALQPIGQANAIALLRHDKALGRNWKRYYASGMQRALRELPTIYGKVSAESTFMRDRIDQIDRDMRDVIRSAKLGDSKSAWARKEAMQLIGRTQLYSVDIPIWLAAYEGGMQELELDHDAAVDFADSIVSRSQGGAGAKDLSAIQRTREGVRQFILFYSYQNTVYNQHRAAFVEMLEGGAEVLPQYITSAMLLYMVPAVASALMRTALTGRSDLPDEDDDNWGIWLATKTASEAMGGIPWVRDMAGIVAAWGGAGKYFGSDTPGQRVGEALASAAKPKASARYLFDLLRLGGMLSGMPISQGLTWIEKATED